MLTYKPAVYLIIVAKVSFENSHYAIGESDGQVQPVLTLQYPSSVIITVQVTGSDNTATSE